MNKTEILGMIASLILLISMALPSTHRKQNIIMRIINIVGSALMIIYGFKIMSYCTIFMNIVIIIIHIYYIIKLLLSYNTNLVEKIKDIYYNKNE